MIGFDYLPIEVSGFKLLWMNPYTVVGKGCKEFITYSEIMIIINLIINESTMPESFWPQCNPLTSLHNLFGF